MDMDFATSCPLVRPVLPRIRLLFVRSRFRSTLPSDGPSRFRPCASLVLHLHQVAQGTFTPRLLTCPAHRTLRAATRWPAAIPDRGGSQRHVRVQAGTKKRRLQPNQETGSSGQRQPAKTRLEGARTRCPEGECRVLTTSVLLFCVSPLGCGPGPWKGILTRITRIKGTDYTENPFGVGDR
jgi:hypothetical protein